MKLSQSQFFVATGVSFIVVVLMIFNVMSYVIELKKEANDLAGRVHTLEDLALIEIGESPEPESVFVLDNEVFGSGFQSVTRTIIPPKVEPSR